jgi:hypothetical protein
MGNCILSHNHEIQISEFNSDCTGFFQVSVDDSNYPLMQEEGESKGKDIPIIGCGGP